VDAACRAADKRTPRLVHVAAFFICGRLTNNVTLLATADISGLLYRRFVRARGLHCAGGHNLRLRCLSGEPHAHVATAFAQARRRDVRAAGDNMKEDILRHFDASIYLFAFAPQNAGISICAPLSCAGSRLPRTAAFAFLVANQRAAHYDHAALASRIPRMARPCRSTL